MKVLISGSSGMVGQALMRYLRGNGHQVVRLMRKASRQSEQQSDILFWDPSTGEIDLNLLEGIDGVVNLAGENIAGGRWTKKRRQEILQSRVQGTKHLTAALCALRRPPAVFISASAIGFYGDRGSLWCNEETASGTGFLADVCRQWEAAAQPANEKGIRTVNLRLGVVLSSKEGALGKMLIPFKLGLGGILGTGSQYMSWIAIDDLVAIIHLALTDPNMKGVVNAVAPEPVSNAEFTRTLAHVLKRPAWMPIPAWLLRLLLGADMANEFLLSSTRVQPMRLSEVGYSFLYPNLDGALKHLV